MLLPFFRRFAPVGAALTLTACFGDVSLGGGYDSEQCTSPSDLTVLAPASYPRALAVDSTTVYWTEEDGGVARALLDGAALPTLAPGVGSPGGIAIDAHNLYETVSGSTGTSGVVLQIPLDGGAPITLASGQDVPVDVATDSSNVYWTTEHSAANTDADGTVVRVPIGGGAPITLASGQDGPTSLAIDETSVYWVTSGFGSGGPSTVMKVPTGGGATVTLASTPSSSVMSFHLDALALNATDAYWVSYGYPPALIKVPLGGGAPSTIASSVFGIVAVTVDSTNVYWAANGPGWSSGPSPVPLTGGVIMSMPLGGGPSTMLADCQSPMTIAVDSSSVYWTNDGTMNGSVITGGSVVKLTPK